MTVAAIDTLKARPKRPRFHGNGFTQLMIRSNMRLHVWHPDLPSFVEHNAMIHNHRYHAFSHVLFGAIINEVYEFVGTTPEAATHTLNLAKDTGLEATGIQGIVRLANSFVVQAPEHYMLPFPQFHVTKADGHVVTLFFRESVDLIPVPQVISPIGLIPTDAFDLSRSPSETRMWEIIEDAITRMTEVGIDFAALIRSE